MCLLWTNVYCLVPSLCTLLGCNSSRGARVVLACPNHGEELWQLANYSESPSALALNQCGTNLFANSPKTHVENISLAGDLRDQTARCFFFGSGFLSQSFTIPFIFFCCWCSPGQPVKLFRWAFLFNTCSIPLAAGLFWRYNVFLGHHWSNSESAIAFHLHDHAVQRCCHWSQKISSFLLAWNPDFCVTYWCEEVLFPSWLYNSTPHSAPFRPTPQLDITDNNFKLYPTEAHQSADCLRFDVGLLTLCSPSTWISIKHQVHTWEALPMRKS